MVMVEKMKFRSWKRVGLVLALLLGLLFLLMFLRASLSTSGEIGVHNMQLAPCPASPNCVSTQTDQADKLMSPLKFTGSPEKAFEALQTVVSARPRTKIVEKQENYIHAECRSALFRFVDDVEFLLDSEQGVIHFRSASRVGYSDLGVNRKRMEEISAAFASAQQTEK